MDSSNKQKRIMVALSATFFILLSASFVLASEKDYLILSVSITNENIKINSITQKIFDDANLPIPTEGTYEVSLIDGSAVVSRGFFEVSDNTADLEVIGKRSGDAGDQYGESQSNRKDALIFLPLTVSAEAANSSIRISKNGQTLLAQKLSEIPINIVSGLNARIITPMPSASFPPFPTEDIPSNNWLFWFFGLAAVISVALTIFLIRHKGQKPQPSINTPQIPLP